MSKNELDKLYEQHCRINPIPISKTQFTENYKANKEYKLKQLAIKNTDLEIEDAKPKKPTNLKRTYKKRKIKIYPDYVECKKCHETKHKSEFVPAQGRRGHELTCRVCRRTLAREKYHRDKKLKALCE